ncbi:unnamed protein product, partial [Polarella glacialis]
MGAAAKMAFPKAAKARKLGFSLCLVLGLLRTARPDAFTAGMRGTKLVQLQPSQMQSTKTTMSAGPDAAEASALLGPLKIASSGMGLLKPLFALEAKLQALSYNEEAIRATLNTEINSAPVVIYTYSLSPFCTEATKLLDSIGAKYQEVLLAPEWFLMLGEGAAKRAELGALYGRTSMPHIFIGGQSIGGLADGPGLLPLFESGELQSMLKAAIFIFRIFFHFLLHSGGRFSRIVDTLAILVLSSAPAMVLAPFCDWSDLRACGAANKASNAALDEDAIWRLLLAAHFSPALRRFGAEMTSSDLEVQGGQLSRRQDCDSFDCEADTERQRLQQLLADIPR